MHFKQFSCEPVEYDGPFHRDTREPHEVIAEVIAFIRMPFRDVVFQPYPEGPPMDYSCWSVAAVSDARLPLRRRSERQQERTFKWYAPSKAHPN